MQHYTRNTLEVSEWCKKCRKYTMHRVDAPKLGPCFQCLKKPDNNRVETPEPAAAEQLSMFNQNEKAREL